MKVINEDPVRRRNPRGSQFCKKIGGIIILLGDVMQLNPLEFVLKLSHLLVVRCHEGAFVGGLLYDLINDQL